MYRLEMPSHRSKQRSRHTARTTDTPPCQTLLLFVPINQSFISSKYTTLGGSLNNI